MGRTNFAVSQWMRNAGTVGQAWASRAVCTAHQDLPWTSDFLPGFDDAEQMRVVCEGCPVIAKCADYGLKAHGGFYAGVWVPWKDHADSSDNTGRLRSRARDHLRRVVKRAMVLA
jgi:hypothetical protein